MKDDAIPTIFPNLPAYLSTPTTSRSNTSHAETRRIKYNEEVRVKCESMLGSDVISDFEDFKAKKCCLSAHILRSFRFEDLDDSCVFCLIDFFHHE